MGDDLNHEFDQFEEMVKESLDNTKNEIQDISFNLNQ